MMLQETNKQLKELLTFEELLQFFGIWCLMSTTTCTFNKREFWSTKEVSMFEGAPFRLHSIMSRRRFEEIMANLKITDQHQPTYKDGLMYAIEIVEGKDEPPQRPSKEHAAMGKTVSLLLRLTKTIWNTGKTVILDSGFCVAKGILELKNKGVFSSALI